MFKISCPTHENRIYTWHRYLVPLPGTVTWHTVTFAFMFVAFGAHLGVPLHLPPTAQMDPQPNMAGVGIGMGVKDPHLLIPPNLLGSGKTLSQH